MVKEDGTIRFGYCDPCVVSVISCPCLVKSSAATRGLFMSLLLYTFAVSFKPL